MNEQKIEQQTEETCIAEAFVVREVSDEALEAAGHSMLGPTRPPQCGTSLMCP
jgi:hypothetical protein